MWGNARVHATCSCGGNFALLLSADSLDCTTENAICFRKLKLSPPTSIFSPCLSANYAVHSDIATSAAVSELRGVVVLSAMLVSSLVSFSSIPVGFALVLFLDSTGNLSVESVCSMYGTIGWIIVVEFCLFLGIFVSAIIVSFSVSGKVRDILEINA